MLIRRSSRVNAWVCALSHSVCVCTTHSHTHVLSLPWSGSQGRQLAHSDRVTDGGSIYLVVGKVSGNLNKGQGSPEGARPEG